MGIEDVEDLILVFLRFDERGEVSDGMEVLTLEESESIIIIYALFMFNFEVDRVERGMIGYEGILGLCNIFDHFFSL